MVELLQRLFGGDPDQLRSRLRAAERELDEGRRATQVLRALERASAAMRRGGTPDELFEVVGSTLGEFGLTTVVMMYEPNGEELGVTYLNHDSVLIERAEKIVGIDRADFRLRFDQTSFHREVLEQGRTVFYEDAAPLMKQVLPWVPGPIAVASARLLGLRGIVGSPLYDGDRVAGMMIVSALDISPQDERVVSLFGTQLSHMMSNMRLTQELQTSLVHLETTQSQLLEAQRREAIGQLAGGVAHDFNNLLSAITLSTELVQGAVRDPAVLADLEIIRESCERGTSLVSQLLALGRRTELKIEPFDVDQMIADLERLLRRVLGEDIRIEIACGDGQKFVEGDRSQLEQVVINLALNARDAMPDGGGLRLQTSLVELSEASGPLSEGPHVELQVVDDGSGMDRAVQGRAFEPFFTTKGRARGTGLGLSVVRSIVEQHRGLIELESEEGGGTTFCIRLPASADRPGAVDATSVRAPARGAGELVLIVEDDALVRRTCSRALQRSGWRVHCVPDGASARLAVEDLGESIQLIFCDVVLPDGRGPRLLDELVPQIPGVSVLVTSGYVDERADRELIAERGWAFLAKPYRHDELLAAVHSLLEAS